MAKGESADSAKENMPVIISNFVFLFNFFSHVTLKKKKKLIYLFWQSVTERESKGVIFHPLVLSPDSRNGQCWDWLKPCPHTWQLPKYLDHLLLHL